MHLLHLSIFRIQASRDVVDFHVCHIPLHGRRVGHHNEWDGQGFKLRKLEYRDALWVVQPVSNGEDQLGHAIGQPVRVLAYCCPI